MLRNEIESDCYGTIHCSAIVVDFQKRSNCMAHTMNAVWYVLIFCNNNETPVFLSRSASKFIFYAARQSFQCWAWNSIQWMGKQLHTHTSLLSMDYVRAWKKRLSNAVDFHFLCQMSMSNDYRAVQIHAYTFRTQFKSIVSERRKACNFHFNKTIVGCFIFFLSSLLFWPTLISFNRFFPLQSCLCMCVCEYVLVQNKFYLSI